MIMLLFYLLASISADSLNYTGLFNYTLRPNQYGQIMINPMASFKVDQEYNPGDFNLRLSLFQNNTTKFDILFFDNPYNQFYVCYIHMMLEQEFEQCLCLIQQYCKPCNSYPMKDLSEELSTSFKTQFVSQNNLTNANSSNSICLLGCDANEVQIEINSFPINKLNNSVSVIVLDNTEFPSLAGCNFNYKDTCLLNKTKDIPEDWDCPLINENFCQSIAQIYCDNYANRGNQFLEVSIEYQIDIIPNTKTQSISLMLIVFLGLVMACLTILLCILVFRYNRIKVQQLEINSIIRQKDE